MESIALFFLPTASESFSTLCCSHVRGQRQCSEGDEVAAEDRDGSVNLLVATDAAEHRHDLAVIILDVDKCDERKFHHFLMGQPLGSSTRS